MALYDLDGHRVAVPPSGRYWVADNAVLVGQVTIEEDASVRFNTVARGDNEPIVIAPEPTCRTAACCIPTSFPLVIRAEATIAHGYAAWLHHRRGALIGIGAIVLNGARIGSE
jgi:carbonic anhydrase/acetyltransferase-like protein (isoleucine patch superfamily)